MSLTFSPVSALFERRRPSSLDELAGQDRLKKQLRLLESRYGTLGGRAYAITGKKGMGKTTTARIIARKVADDYAIEEIDAGDIDEKWIERYRRAMYVRPLGEKGGWALIVNEVHGLKAKAARLLLTLIEPPGGMPSWGVIVFTTTKKGQETLFEGVDDAGPLFSRCVRIELEERGQSQPIVEAIMQAAVDEGLAGPDLDKMRKAVLRAVNESCGDVREVYNQLESGFFLE